MRNLAPYLRIALLLIIALVVGFFTVRDYGQSWDEADIYRYADYALNSYQFFFHPRALPPFDTNLNLYGPAYYMAVDVVARVVTQVLPMWSRIDAWHFLYFLTFLGCALAVYLLSRRWTSEAGALGATAIFLSQPLLWGHAFINPKDIPFMALFAASIAVGFAMADRYNSGPWFGAILLLASLLLGITASLRVIGPLAGLIVLGYTGYKLRWKVIAVAIPYVVIASITAYVTWPYLWSAPVAHYIESIKTMSQFPFATLVLFWGQLYKANQLPMTYFPTLLIFQLSEPALLLLGVGVVSLGFFWARKANREALMLLLAWFLLPALLIIGLGSPLYDNGRQLYFLLPPLFIMMGMALDRLYTFQVLARPAMKAAVVLFCAVPGLLLSIRLHPYEYVYYNSLVGGTGSAFREFEMDYWGTSLKEMTEYVNATASADTRLLVFGPEQTVAQYSRPDIQVAIPREEDTTKYDYAVLLTRENLDERRCKGAETVYTIGRRGAVFAVLKRIASGMECR